MLEKLVNCNEIIKYIDRLRNSGLGKNKTLEYLTKYITKLTTRHTYNRGVLGRKLYSDKTLNNMRKSELIELLHVAEHNYDSLMWFYNNAVNVNIDKLNKWISVEERLPKDNVRVLIQTEWDCQLIALRRNGVWNGHWENYDDDEVLYWQPLPELYAYTEREKEVIS